MWRRNFHCFAVIDFTLSPIYNKFGSYNHPPNGVKTFKATFYSSSQLIIFVSDEWKVFKRVKHLWVLNFHKNNAFSVIASNGIIFEIFQPIGVELLRTNVSMLKKFSCNENHNEHIFTVCNVVAES